MRMRNKQPLSGFWLLCMVVVLFFFPREQLSGKDLDSILVYQTEQSPVGVSPKRASSSIAITTDGSTLLVVNPDSNSLSLVDTATNAVLGEIPVGREPRSVALSADNSRAYVANWGSDSLSIIDITTHTQIEQIPVGDRPAGVVVSPDGQHLVVAEYGDDTIRVLNSSDLSMRRLYQVQDRPYGLAYTPDGRRILVTHLLSGEVSILTSLAYSVYLPVIAAPLAKLPTVRISKQQHSEEKTMLGSTIPTWPNVAPAPAVLVNADGTRAYLPQTMANGLGLNTQFDTTVFPKVSVLNLESDTHQTSEHISLPETDQPVGLPWDAALAKGESELWVVNAASNDVSVVDINNPANPSRVANIPVGDNPRGIVLNPDGNAAYVNNTLAGTVSLIDAQTYTVTQVITITEIPLPPVLLHGKRLFHTSDRPDLARARWIACNTCHVEGEHDGRTWLLQYLGELPPGEQPVVRRNTTSLLGMIETYPLRWSAEWDESADSEFSVRFEQFGTGLIDGEMHPTLGLPNQGRSYDLDCLAAFIDSLSVPGRTYTLDPAEQRGKAIFESSQTQCLDCHPPPLYTDLQTHDVGTADGIGEWFGPLIDTPSLRFLYDSAPYLHDGTAQSISEVFTVKNPNDEHGVTSHLSQSELEDLVAYLHAIPYKP